MSTERTDDEMRAAIAGALGWKKNKLGAWWSGSVFKASTLPDWLSSLDACARDLLPVARERGWWYEYAYDPDWNRRTPEEFGFRSEDGIRPTVYAYAPTGEIARALCEAWLAGPGKDGGQ